MAERTKPQRKQDIVFLNILFCMLVILIHISSEIILDMGRGRKLYWIVFVLSRLSGFVVQGFILLSGVKLFLKSGKLHYGRFYLSRLVSVILPYAAWVCIYYAWFCFKGVYAFSWPQLGRFLLYGDISAQFYFVVILVQFYLLAPLWRLLFHRANPAVALAVSLMITILSGSCLEPILHLIWPNANLAHLDLFFTRYLFYWTAGCMIGLYYQEFQRYLRTRWPILTLFFLLCAALNAYLAAVCIDNPPFWLDQVHILYCISALLFFYMLAQLFANRGGALLKPLAWLDRATYHIYLVHCLVLFMVNDYMNAHGITDYVVRYGLRALLVYAGSILLCLLWQLVKRGLVAAVRKT